MNIRADVIWALRGQPGGLTIRELAAKISSARGVRYSEVKIEGVLDMFVRAGQVEKLASNGRVIYSWTTPAS